MKNKSYDSFIFTHIPKCGGTSFRQLINESAIESGIEKGQLYIPGFNELANDKNIDQLDKGEKDQFRKSSYKVIAAHSKFNIHKEYELEYQNPFYYTILRDPVKRFISHYHFFYYKLGYDDLKGVSIGELKEEKLLFLLRRLSNVQTTFLANFKFKKVLGEDNLLKLAKYNLQYEYADFGIVEEMDSSINRLKNLLPDWLAINGSLPVLNTSNSEKHEISSDIRSMISENNKSDIDLVQFGRNLIQSKTAIEIL